MADWSLVNICGLSFSLLYLAEYSAPQSVSYLWRKNYPLRKQKCDVPKTKTRNTSDQAKLRNEGCGSNPRTPIRCGPDASHKQSCCVVVYCCQTCHQVRQSWSQNHDEKGGLEVFWLLVKKLIFSRLTSKLSTTSC